MNEYHLQDLTNMGTFSSLGRMLSIVLATTKQNICYVFSDN